MEDKKLYLASIGILLSLASCSQQQVQGPQQVYPAGSQQVYANTSQTKPNNRCNNQSTGCGQRSQIIIIKPNVIIKPVIAKPRPVVRKPVHKPKPIRRKPHRIMPHCNPCAVKPVHRPAPRCNPCAVKPVHRPAPRCNPCAVKPVHRPAPRCNPCAVKPVHRPAPRCNPCVKPVRYHHPANVSRTYNATTYYRDGSTQYAAPDHSAYLLLRSGKIIKGVWTARKGNVCTNFRGYQPTCKREELSQPQDYIKVVLGDVNHLKMRYMKQGNRYH